MACSAASVGQSTESNTQHVVSRCRILAPRGVDTWMLQTELISDSETLEGVIPEWDALATVSPLPLMSPGWIMAWWAHLAPPTTQPRVVVAREYAKIVGLAPFFVEPDTVVRHIDYRLPGISIGRAPLAAPEREQEVAKAIGSALAQADPYPDVIAFDASPIASRWHLALRAGWSGRIRPLVRQYRLRRCATVSLCAGSYDEWLRHKSPNFRQQMRKFQRRFAAAGGTVRLSTRETLSADIATVIRLHSERWRDRGGSEFLEAGSDRLALMLEQAGHALVDDGRFRLMILEVNGEPASAILATAAGGEVLGINGGWDERFASLSPLILCILALIEDAFERGDKRFNLSIGEQEYKERFADGNDHVSWAVVLPPGRRLPMTAARVGRLLAREKARDIAERALSPEKTERLRAIKRRVGRSQAESHLDVTV